MNQFRAVELATGCGLRSSRCIGVVLFCAESSEGGAKRKKRVYQRLTALALLAQSCHLVMGTPNIDAHTLGADHTRYKSGVQASTLIQTLEPHPH